MDVQMPEMDGFEATREIRKREAGSGSHGHMPIIAMTAYATGGDRERCLEAGMDDYVSKPISASKLFQAIEALVPPAPEEKASASAGTPADGQKPVSLNADGLIRAFENDQHLFQELVEIFLSDSPQMLNTLRDSLKSTDAKTFKRTAHSLKGMLRNFQAESAAETAFELEQIGEQGKLDDADQIVDHLASQLDEVSQQLKQVVKKISGGG
jgi:DNA-binding response OmpR family regulator